MRWAASPLMAVNRLSFSARSGFGSGGRVVALSFAPFCVASRDASREGKGSPVGAFSFEGTCSKTGACSSLRACSPEATCSLEGSSSRTAPLSWESKAGLDESADSPDAEKDSAAALGTGPPPASSPSCTTSPWGQALMLGRGRVGASRMPKGWPSAPSSRPSTGLGAGTEFGSGITKAASSGSAPGSPWAEPRGRDRVPRSAILGSGGRAPRASRLTISPCCGHGWRRVRG